MIANAWDWKKRPLTFYSQPAYFEDVHHPMEDQGVDFID